MARKAKKKKVPDFVLDSSVALAWCFPDEKAEYPLGLPLATLDARLRGAADELRIPGYTPGLGV